MKNIKITKIIFATFILTLLSHGLCGAKMVYAEEQVTQEEQITQQEQVTQEQQVTLEPEKKKVKQLPKVKHVSCVRYSTSSVKLSWDKCKKKKAKYYKVFYAKKKNGKLHKAGTTRNTWYRVKGLKNHKKYYFYVVASEKKRKAQDSDSEPSKVISMTMRDYDRKTIFGGDSITEGIDLYALSAMHIGGRKKVVASVGVNTMTFRSRCDINGRSCLGEIISQNPYRVYLMLGINELFGRKYCEVFEDYTYIVHIIKDQCPNTEIVMLAVSPVTKALLQQRPGYKQINKFNEKLSKLVDKESRLRYYDYTSYLKDANGYLKKEYAQADGFHWKVPAYLVFANKITEYEKSIDN